MSKLFKVTRYYGCKKCVFISRQRLCDTDYKQCRTTTTADVLSFRTVFLTKLSKVHGDCKKKITKEVPKCFNM